MGRLGLSVAASFFHLREHEACSLGVALLVEATFGCRPRAFNGSPVGLCGEKRGDMSKARSASSGDASGELCGMEPEESEMEAPTARLRRIFGSGQAIGYSKTLGKG